MRKGMLQRRLTITPHGTLLGWRRLNPLELIYSGQLFRSDPGVLVNQYIPYIKFDFITHFPHLTDAWEEHYLGERNGVFITMFIKNRSTVTGPTV